MCGRSMIIVLSLVGLIPWSVRSAEAQQPRPSAKVVQFNNSNAAATEGHYAIIGEIGRPGVFHAASRISVQELVQQAGGLSVNASANLRVIRQGRAGQRIFFQQQGNDALFPGDVVVVDAAQNPSGMGRVVSSPGESPASPQSDSGVLIAMLGLIDRPVVVRVHREEAELGLMIQKLGQAPQIAATVRVIPGAVMPQPMPTSAPDPRILLGSGSVLLFDRSRVDPRRLPDFPKAVEWNERNVSESPRSLQAPMDADPRAIAEAPHRIAVPAESYDPRQGMVSVPGQQQRSGVPNPFADAGVPTPMTLKPLPAEMEPSKSPVVRERGPIPVTTTPWSSERYSDPAPRVRSSMPMVETTGPVPQPIETPATKGWRQTPAQPASSPNGNPTDFTAGSASSSATKPAAFSGLQMVGIVGIVAGLIGLAVVTSRLVDKSEMSHATSHSEQIASQGNRISQRHSGLPMDVAESALRQTVAEKSSRKMMADSTEMQSSESTSGFRNELLEMLIRNQIPLAEEQWDMPRGLDFPHRPVEEKINRLDAAQHPLHSESTAPHFVQHTVEERATAEMHAGDRDSSRAFERALFRLQGERRP